MSRFFPNGSREASIITEVHPASMHRRQNSTSRQWSRCRATGTGESPAVCRAHSTICSGPQWRTVRTDVCTMTGASSSSAARTTASIEL